MVRIGTPISQVEGVFNAVVAEGDQVGTTLYAGRGAGGGADRLGGGRRPRRHRPRRAPAGVRRAERAAAAAAARRRWTATYGAYYFRLMVVDRPGVMADVAACLRDHEVSIEALIQRARNPDEPVPIVLTTHETAEAQMTGALGAHRRARRRCWSRRGMIRIETL